MTPSLISSQRGEYSRARGGASMLRWRPELEQQKGDSVLKWLMPVVASGLCALSWCATIEAKPPGDGTTAMDRDLMEVSIPRLQSYYAQHRYTVSQVVDWYLKRIERYNGVYRPVE